MHEKQGDFIPEKGHQNDAQKEQKERMLRSFATGKEDEIALCKQEYLEAYPNDNEGVNILFEMVSLLKQASMLPGGGDTSPENSMLLINKAEFTQRFANYLLENSENRDFLARFWDHLLHIASWGNIVDLFEKYRHNIITEVATCRALKDAGVEPKFPDPWEDILLGIDMEIRDGREFIQVKGVRASVKDGLFIISSQDSKTNSTRKAVLKSLPLVNNSSRERYWKKTLSKFAEDTEALSIGLNRDVTGYLVSMPYGQCDMITGMPSEAVLDYFKDYFEENK